ncbi:translation initiation factor IF-2, mitochondrial [Dorcoceras hygrometricum]|uniref:Translation initiation factor IF-2, mitochondrial n=1 Tax=Dorcoceras hygrometricum TaxID=472368 RepID=A0A2Z7AZV5_9LAMI|nr:translation initiation factor IF-2, mitochondrial [Dorcoceras hygrometricum]
MGSNPSTESNNKTVVNSKNEMQMLWMRKETTAQRKLQRKYVATVSVGHVGATHSPLLQVAIAIGLDDIRKDVFETKAALSNAILDFHAQAQENYNNLSSQLGELVAIAIGLDDIRKDVFETKAALSNAILDFHAQAQENYNNLSSQLGELVAYINHGNDKNGEESNSRRPQPPPDDQNRPSTSSKGNQQIATVIQSKALQDQRLMYQLESKSTLIICAAADQIQEQLLISWNVKRIVVSDD